MELIFLFLIFLFGGLIGFFTAYMIQSMRSENKDSSPKESKKTAGASIESDDLEIARLLSKTTRPILIVEMDGQRYTNPDQLGEIHRNRVAKAVEDLSSWIKPPEVKIETKTDYPAPIVRPPTVLPKKTAGASDVRPVSLNPLDLFVPGQSKGGTRMKSLAEQIDEVLQEQIGDSTRYPEIHLTDSPGKGLLVVLGSETYEGIDSIPDLEIRNLIQGAVKEWEKRTTLKK
jgi:hypothetical protein